MNWVEMIPNYESLSSSQNLEEERRYEVDCIEFFFRSMYTGYKGIGLKQQHTYSLLSVYVWLHFIYHKCISALTTVVVLYYLYTYSRNSGRTSLYIIEGR